MKIIELSRSGGDILAISKLILNGEVQMDVTSDTVAAGSLLSGKTATKNDGTKVTGTIASKSSSDLTVSGATVTTPAGYYANAASKAVATTTHPNPSASIASSTGVVTASHTQETGYVAGGTTTGTLSLTTQSSKTVTPTETAQTAVASYRWTTGPINVAAISSTYVGTGIANKSSSDLTVSGATVTAPAGYYANAASKAVTTVAHPDPTVVLTSSTGTIVAGHAQETGYVTGTTTTAILNLTKTAAKTITPTESVQTAVASYRWTTGDVNVAAISSTYVGTGVPKYSAGDLVASGSGVTVLTGYYSSTVTKLVAAGSAFPPAVTITKAPTIGVNTSGVVTASYNGSSSITPTVTSGYVSQGTAGTISTTGTSTYQLTSQAAATYYPSTADQTIASQRWLIGNQTIKSVTTSNLTAANIAEGVVVKVGDSVNASRITQITGTHSGGGFTCTITGTGGDYNGAYIEYKGRHYYSNNSNFTFNSGEQINICLFDSNLQKTITVDGVQIISQQNSQIDIPYTLPAGDITIDFSADSQAVYITITTEKVYMATIKNRGNSNYCYIQHNDIKYYSFQSFSFHEGDTLTIYCKGDNLTINENQISLNNYSYTYTLPPNDILITFQYTSQTNNSVVISPALKYTATISGTGDSTGQYIQYNGIKYYTNGATFTFKAGDSIIIYSIASKFINGERQSGSAMITWTAPIGDISINLSSSATEIFTVVYPSGDLNISANGIYNVYSYSQANVDLPYYEVYKTIAFKSNIYSTNSNFQSFFSNMSIIPSSMFQNVLMSGDFTFPNCTVINRYGFGHTGYNTCGSCTFNLPEVTYISNAAFQYQSLLTNIEAPKVSIISDAAFAYCTALTSISFPICTTIGGYAFQNCTSLVTINVPNCQTIGYNAFESCRSLITVSFPNCTVISANAFSNCRSLITVNFPKCTTIPNNAFNTCLSLSDISFPICTTIGGYAFNQCQKIITVDFPACTTIGSYAFSVCLSLTTISFPACTTIGAYAFYSCRTLSTVNLPKCVAINMYTFYGCTNLTTVSLSACTSIDTYAFRSCYNLLSLYLLGSSIPTLASTNAFISTPISAYTTSTGGVYGSIYVPSSLYNSYLTATNWSQFSSRFVSV